ncbi:MAG: hypothetical protein R8K47_04510 [Mariprofundaceae bacterium]
MLPKWILLKKFCEMTGYTKHAFHAKKQRGVWLEGLHWKYGPDGHIFINWREVDRWVEADQGSKYGASASASHSSIVASAAGKP